MLRIGEQALPAKDRNQSVVNGSVTGYLFDLRTTILAPSHGNYRLGSLVSSPRPRKTPPPVSLKPEQASSRTRDRLPPGKSGRPARERSHERRSARGGPCRCERRQARRR